MAPREPKELFHRAGAVNRESIRSHGLLGMERLLTLCGVPAALEPALLGGLKPAGRYAHLNGFVFSGRTVRG